MKCYYTNRYFFKIKMAVSYNKLWKLLIEKGMTNADLRMKTSLSMFTLAKMSKNENV